MATNWIVSERQQYRLNCGFKKVVISQALEEDTDQYNLLREVYYRGLIICIGEDHVPEQWLEWANV